MDTWKTESKKTRSKLQSSVATLRAPLIHVAFEELLGVKPDVDLESVKLNMSASDLRLLSALPPQRHDQSGHIAAWLRLVIPTWSPSKTWLSPARLRRRGLRHVPHNKY